MRILLLSDLHGNPWAVNAIEQCAGPVDFILCAGDVVNYGPDPSATISWLRDHHAIVVRGNHDHAVGFDLSPRAASEKAHLATTLRYWTRSRLSARDLEWLQRLPVQLTWEIKDRRFQLFHGTPCDVLFDYRMKPQISDSELDALLTSVQGEVVVAGHTHLPFVRRRGRSLVVNPGSAGQPLDGDPRASYAIWQDGEIELRRVDYDQTRFWEALVRMNIPEADRQDLLRIARNARL